MICHDMQDFDSLTYDEMEFIAEETTVSIIPLVHMEAVNLITVCNYSCKEKSKTLFFYIYFIYRKLLDHLNLKP